MNDELTYFGDVISALAADRKISVAEVAREIKYDKSMISLVGKGERKCSKKMAHGLSNVLGGDTSKWLEVYSKTERGSSNSIASFRNFLIGNEGETRPAMDRKQIAIETFSAIVIPFDINGMDGTTYDATLGFIVDEDGNEVPIESPSLTFEPGVLWKVATFEKFCFSSEQEGIAHGTSTLAQNHLRIDGGLFVHSGFTGHLHASVKNEGQKPITVTRDEPFITLKMFVL